LQVDTSIMLNIIKNKHTIEIGSNRFDISIGKNNRVTLHCNIFTIEGTINTGLFKRVKWNKYVIKKHFTDFDNEYMLKSDIDYKILSSIKFRWEYKCMLYSLVKMSRSLMNSELAEIKSKEVEIYEKLKELIALYSNSSINSERIQS